MNNKKSTTKDLPASVDFQKIPNKAKKKKGKNQKKKILKKNEKIETIRPPNKTTHQENYDSSLLLNENLNNFSIFTKQNAFLQLSFEECFE